MSTASMPHETSPAQNLPRQSSATGTQMDPFLSFAASALVVASIVIFTVHLASFTVPSIDLDAIALEFAVRCR